MGRNTQGLTYLTTKFPEATKMHMKNNEKLVQEMLVANRDIFHFISCDVMYSFEKLMHLDQTYSVVTTNQQY